MEFAGPVTVITQSVRSSLRDVAVRASKVEAEAMRKENPGVALLCRIATERLKPLPKILNEIEELERTVTGLNEHKERMSGNAAELLRADNEIGEKQAKIAEGRTKVEKELNTISSLLDGAQMRL